MNKNILRKLNIIAGNLENFKDDVKRESSDNVELIGNVDSALKKIEQLIQIENGIGVGVIEADGLFRDIEGIAKSDVNFEKNPNILAGSKNAESFEQTIATRSKEFSELPEDSKIDSPTEIKVDVLKKVEYSFETREDQYKAYEVKNLLDKEGHDEKETYSEALERGLNFEGVLYERDPEDKSNIMISIWEPDLAEEKDLIERGEDNELDKLEGNLENRDDYYDDYRDLE